MAAKYQPVMRKDSMKYTWRIENYSQFKSKKVSSDTFRAGGYKWRIRVLTDEDDFLTAKMHFADGNTVHGGWSVTPEMSLTIVHPLNASLSKRIRFSESFCPENGYWISNYLGSVASLVREGFLVDDTLIIEAELSIVEPDRNLASKLYDTLAKQPNLWYPFTVSSDVGGCTLQEICTRFPRTKEELLRIHGIGKEDVKAYGDRLLRTIEATVRDYYKKERSGNCGYVIGDSYSPENQGQWVLEDSDDPDVIEPEVGGQAKGDSDSPPSKKVARTSTVVSPCSSNVQLASKNLIAELSSMAGIHVSTNDSGHHSAELQQQREKMAKFFDMSLESIYEANCLCNVQELVLKISELVTNPFEKTVLENLLSHLVEFRSCIPDCLSTLESSRSSQHTAKELEGSLFERHKQVTFLDSEISRIEAKKMEVKAEIQLLVDLEEKLDREKDSTVGEIEATSREASMELGELKRKCTEHAEALENGLRAEERLARANGSWKLYKGKLDYKKNDLVE